MTKPKASWLASVIVILAVAPWRSEAAAANIQAFLQKHCVECHDSETKKGGLDLTALSLDLTARNNFATWVTVHDRASAGEMPPKKKARPEPAEVAAFTNTLSASLLAADQARVAREGRATQRRLNRHEYEDTLRDLLALPYLEVKAFLPEDSEAHGFNKIGDALDVSHVQMARYLTAAEFALRQAMAPQVTPPESTTNRYYTWQQREFFGKIKLDGPLVRRTFPVVGLELQRELMAANAPRRVGITTNAERREMEAMAVVVSTYEPTEIRFGGFRAPVSGKYRLKFSAYSIWMGPKFTEVSAGRRSEPVVIYAEAPPTSLRKLGTFDADPEPTVREMEAWLLAGETIRPDAARFFRSRPPDHKNPLAGPDGMPALAFRWMEVEGPIVDQWPPAGHRLLFGDLPLAARTASATEGRRALPPGVDIVSQNPDQDAEKLLRGFMQQSYRGPVQDAEVERFLTLIRGALKNGYSFTDAMIAGYTGVLSSPAFLYLKEKPGRLDDLALAERLSYFLGNSRPDAELRQLAGQRELHRPEVLTRQTERLLNDPKARRFVDSFLDYWLDLRLIAGTAPDEQLYPDYQLDDLLVESMIEETQLFFGELLKRNLSVTHLVASDFAVLNDRLAAHYGIPGVEGVALRPVSLPKESVRGGLLTQASVLKVTANGTTTSPVKRGAWIMARLLGKPPPPPPASVPAVEPDIRGATTIRDQLAKHRTEETCAACHRNIDPAGFALESFDVMGAWRERYRSMGEGEPVKGIGHNGLNFHFREALGIDSSGELPDGRTFRNVRELREHLAREPEQLARNLVQQLVIYATGAPIQFSDRPLIAKILARSQTNGYGVRTLIHEIVQSDLFLNK
jgi:mono/diheme cytochrome c family protein